MAVRDLTNEELDTLMRQYLLGKVNAEGSLNFCNARLTELTAEKERREQPRQVSTRRPLFNRRKN